MESRAGGEVVETVVSAGTDLSLRAGGQRFCTAWLSLTPAAPDWPASTRCQTSPF